MFNDYELAVIEKYSSIFSQWPQNKEEIYLTLNGAFPENDSSISKIIFAIGYVQEGKEAFEISYGGTTNTLKLETQLSIGNSRLFRPILLDINKTEWNEQKLRRRFLTQAAFYFGKNYSWLVELFNNIRIDQRFYYYGVLKK